MSETVLAIDIGGTKIAAAVVDAEGTVLTEQLRPTPASEDAEVVFEAVESAVRGLLADLPAGQDRIRVGISTAGPIDSPTGTISPVNIGAWRGFAISARVHQVIASANGDGAVRVALAGDGHCFALGEHWLGAARDVDSMIGLVLSTGVGGGAVLNNRLFTGTTGNAVHLGHISVNAWGPRCVCGGHGCTEMYARGPALVAAARRLGWVGGDDARALTAAARAGDEIAVGVIDHGMRALAAGIATTATELDVAVVVLGGGVSRAGEVIFNPLRRHLLDFAVLGHVADLEVRAATLETAGLLGAAALAFSQE
ncbi:MAG: ROK family protein [Microlunatus sp.]|nr:ROK family protein [Microlunatus sp.]